MSFVRLVSVPLLAVPLLGIGCSFEGAGFPRDGGGTADARSDGGGSDGPGPAPEGVATAVALPAGTAIVVDGDLDDWGSATFTPFSSLTSGHVDVYGHEYTASVSVQFAMYYTPGALYFAFRVSDAGQGEPSDELFDDDSIEIYLDTDGDGGGPYEPHDHYLVASAAGACRQLAGGGFPVTQCDAVATPGIGYNIELVVSLLSIDLTPPLPAEIGFGLAVNDDDQKDNEPPFSDDRVDGYVPWYWNSAGGCTNGCCTGDQRVLEHTEGWCDTSRLGRLRFQ
jgi:hypothetical protein